MANDSAARDDAATGTPTPGGAGSDGPAPARVRVGAATDVGCVREANEDAYVVADAVFAVADGMGGHVAGEVASAITVRVLADLTGGASEDDVRAAVRAANDAILDGVREDPIRRGMGTTAVGLVLAGDEWRVFNVGDSRVYRFADDAIEQVSADHSEVGELVRSGMITDDEAREHPLRNVVTRALGVDPAPEADVWTCPVVAGERWLVCSDGLSNELHDSEIADVLRFFPEAQDAADELVKRALDAGGHDNVTVIVVDV